MTKKLPRTLAHLAPPAALFALTCALLAPASPAPKAARSPRSARARQERAAPAPTPTPLPSNSVIYGRAVYEDTNRPVRRARVMLVSDTGARTDYNALTNSDGDFAISGVRAGSYMAFVDVPGVLSPIAFINIAEMRGGSPDFSEARQFFDIVEVDGKEDARFTLHARRGGALSGRVVHADGDPAVGIAVNFMRRGPGGKLQKQLPGINIVSIAALRTDDRGAFRVAGLPPGDYVLSVAEEAEHGRPSGRGFPGRDPMQGVFQGLVGQQFLTTFYPSATSAKEATVVKVEAGVERAGLDITIPERGLHTVEGVVRGRRDRRPVADARVTLARVDDESAPAAPKLGPHPYEESERDGEQVYTTTDAQGRWFFTDIPDGRYTLTVRPTSVVEDSPTTAPDGDPGMNSNMNGAGQARTRRRRAYSPALREVQVMGGDVSEVSVELGDGGSISGTVTHEGGEQQYMLLSFRRVPEAGQTPGDAWQASTSEGRFAAEGLPPGKYWLAPSVSLSEGRAYVKSMTWNGRDLTREPVELGDGAEVSGVRVVMAHSSSRLSVRALAPSRKVPAGGAVVYLLPADLSAWTPYGAQFSCTTGDDGSCFIDAPPGDYRAVALVRAGEASLFSGELKARAAAAPRVTLGQGETKEVELTTPAR